MIRTVLSMGVALVAMNAGAVAWGNAASRPNVVVFLADDAAWGDVSRNGNTSVSTPRIDSLARDGVTLDRFYVCPVCSPTRAEFLTGRYHPRTGVRGVSTGQERLDLDEKTVADAFRAAGYATGAFGKWHNGSQWPYHLPHVAACPRRRAARRDRAERSGTELLLLRPLDEHGRLDDLGD